MFDGDPDTYFDAESVFYWDGLRLNGGCLRVDLGRAYDVSRVEIEFFEIGEPVREVKIPHVGEMAQYTAQDLIKWTNAPLSKVSVTEENVIAPVVKDGIHTVYEVTGVKKTAVYEIGGAMRYFRLDEPMDRIYAFRIFDKNGVEMKADAPHANNMLSPFEKKSFIRAKKVTVRVPEDAPIGSYLAAGIDGIHGEEGAYCGAACEGKPVGFTDRAVCYPVNIWEHRVHASEEGYTYYLTVDDTIRGKDVEITFLLENEGEVLCRVWLCDSTDKKPVETLE